MTSRPQGVIRVCLFGAWHLLLTAHASAQAPGDTAVEASSPAPTLPPAAATPTETKLPEPPLRAAPRSFWTDHPVEVDEQSWVPGDGLEFVSKDDKFSMAIRLRGQFLYTVERGYDAQSRERDEPKQNLTLRRARITFAGHMWGPKTQYKVELAIAPADLGMTHVAGTDNPPILSNRDNYPSRALLHDWYVQFSQLRDLNLRVGQWKVPFSRERVISSGDLQFVDRSLTNQEFNLDRDIGIEFRSNDLFGLNKQLRYYAGVYNGDGRSQYDLQNFGLMYLARLEFLPLGNFKDYSEADFARSDTPGLSLGVAFAHVQDAAGNRAILGSRPHDGGTTDYNNMTADVMFKFGGLSLESMWFWREGERQRGDAVDMAGAPIPTEPPRNGWGGGAQAGFLLPMADLELALRYSALRRIGASRDSSLGDANEIAVAASYYFARHSLKLQSDWTRYWGPGSGAGRAFADSEELYRVQLQAAF
jgi:phosphate-selective porin OprO and OprP